MLAIAEDGSHTVEVVEHLGRFEARRDPVVVLEDGVDFRLLLP